MLASLLLHSATQRELACRQHRHKRLITWYPGADKVLNLDFHTSQFSGSWLRSGVEFCAIAEGEKRGPEVSCVLAEPLRPALHVVGNGRGVAMLHHKGRHFAKQGSLFVEVPIQRRRLPPQAAEPIAWYSARPALLGSADRGRLRSLPPVESLPSLNLIIDRYSYQ